MESIERTEEKNNKPSFILLTIFWGLIAAFVMVVCEFFIPLVRDLFRGSLLFLLPFIIFSLLGLVLLFLTIKEKIGGALKKFLLLTGISSAGFFVSVFLHNAFYALGIVVSHIIVLKYLMEGFNVAFFMIGIFVCPLGFLVGVVGSVICLKKA